MRSFCYFELLSKKKRVFVTILGMLGDSPPAFVFYPAINSFFRNTNLDIVYGFPSIVISPPYITENYKTALEC